MNKFLVEYKKKKNKRANKRHIIDCVVEEIKNINLLTTPVSELYRSISNIQQNLKNIQ